MEPKVIIECENTSCKHHDGFHNCKVERIRITDYKVFMKDNPDEEINYPTCRSVE